MEAAKFLASASLSKYSSKVGFCKNGILFIVFSTIAVISRKPIRLRKNANTAISLAAFKIQGRLPPLFNASSAKAKLRNVRISGSSKESVEGFLKSYLGKLLGNR